MFQYDLLCLPRSAKVVITHSFVWTRFDFHHHLSPGAYPIAYVTAFSPEEVKWTKPEDDYSAAFNI